MPRAAAPAEPANPSRPWLVMAVVGSSTLLSSLTFSMVNLALPVLGREFGAGVEDSRWVVQAFLLVVVTALPLAGRASDLIGHRCCYLVGFALIAAAAVACGASPSLPWLIGARMLQGLGGAMVMASGPAILTTTFPGHQRGRALGLVATATYLGLTLGPPLGGLILASWGWRWTFYLVAPVGLVILGLGFGLLPRSAPRVGQRFDWPGAASLALGLPGLLCALSEIPRHGPADPRVFAPGVVGLLALAGFVWWQLRAPAPLVDLRLFRSRQFTGAVLSALANYVALFSVNLLMPFYLVEGLGLGARAAGLLLSVQPALMAVAASPSGWLSDRWGSRGLATAGMIIMAGGLAGAASLGVASPIPAIAGWLAVVGLGTGIFISPNSNALMGSAPRAQQGAAASLLAEARNLGMLFGVALASAVFAAAGGRTGEAWSATDFAALRVALLVGAGAALLGAVPAALRGPRES